MGVDVGEGVGLKVGASVRVGVGTGVDSGWVQAATSTVKATRTPKCVQALFIVVLLGSN